MTKNENLLVTLMEECAELQQAVSKALRFGMYGYQPSYPEKTNEHNIMIKYYQLVAAMEMLENAGVLHAVSLTDKALARKELFRKTTKKINVGRYQEVSESIGRMKD